MRARLIASRRSSSFLILPQIASSVAQPLVLPEIATDKDQFWAEFARPPSRHTPRTPKRWAS
jgi:hypothetical protein